jgi:hypothetical protein
MAQGGAIVETDQRLDAEDGRLFVTQTRSGTVGAKGTGDLLELEFRALKAMPEAAITAVAGQSANTDQPSPTAARPSTISISVTP